MQLTASTTKLQLQDVDYAANMVLFLMIEANSAGLELGELLGKTFDLTKAYKQLAIVPEHQRHAVVGFPIEGTWQFYRSMSLPFGCTGSVYGFVRMSQALWYIVTKLLSAVTCHYFDDFPTVERSQGCKVLSLAFSAILDMLGWQHAKEGGKALNFSEAFDLLGVTFNLTQVPKGILKITNKVSRISKLCGILDSIASAGELSSSRASELQGLLNFAVGFFSGKSLKHLVAAFMPHADKPAKMVSEQLGHLCSYAKTMLQSLGPRVHTALGEKRPVLFFTDAAWEDKKATAGAVVIDGTFRACAAVVVPDALVEHWTRHAGEQIISQVEMWPCWPRGGITDSDLLVGE